MEGEAVAFLILSVEGGGGKLLSFQFYGLGVNGGSCCVSNSVSWVWRGKAVVFLILWVGGGGGKLLSFLVSISWWGGGGGVCFWGWIGEALFPWPLDA